ncbi:MAG: hypothetical protein IJT39_05825 [Bacteroidales bacterium]|nr:hypothetical protein [Bacteroidales bacterium]
MKDKIKNTIKAINEARTWEVNVDESKRYSWRKKLTDIQRQLTDISYALEENCSVAAFGESQMGKSYLVSAMLSEPGVPFCVQGGDKSYNFIDEINPSAPNSSVEATGVVTRFTSALQSSDKTPKGWLRVRMLTIPDIVLVLAEAYYNQVIRHIRNGDDLKSEIESRIKSCRIATNANPLLTAVDIATIEDYLRTTSTIGVNCENVLSTNLFQFLLQNVGNISNDDTLALLKLIWNNNLDINRLFDDLMKYYRELGFQSFNYVDFKSVIRKHGSLLDVARLDEMYSDPEAVSAFYEPQASVKLSPDGVAHTLPKSFLSALTAELCFVVDKQGTNANRSFMDYLDILDFPGLRPKQSKNEDDLSVGKSIAIVFRRGKVTYLFNKYSHTKRISSLLFCHNNNQSTECTMGPVLSEWVSTNVGRSFSDRKSFIENTQASPLMVVSTWFNRDLDYNNEARDADLGERWNRRFKIVLSKEVLQSIDKPDHWFNSWTSSGTPFKCIFMLRDFKFSKGIFRGYNPDLNQQETEAIENDRFPDYLAQLKRSFTTNKFVRNHFENPERHWDAAASPACDGTITIIEHLNSLAPRVNGARLQKFNNDYNLLVEELRSLLLSEYHDDDPAEQTRKAKKEAGRVIVGIDRQCGNNPYFWSRMMESMMIPERIVREAVFGHIKGNELSKPLSKPESEIFMAAGLDTEASYDDNLSRLCDYLGADDKKECEEILKDIDPDIDIDKLLEQNKMVESTAEQLLISIEKIWQTDFLSVKVAGGSGMPDVNTIVAKLVALYRELDVHKVLVREIQHLMDSIIQNKQVGIVASWLTMSLNKFVGEFGYGYIDESTMRSIAKKNEDFKLNIDFDMLNYTDQGYGIDLLKQMDEVQHSLEQEGFTAKVREQQKLLPQYRSRWQWQNRMRAAFAVVSGLRDYNIEANNEIKRIIDSIN